MAKETTIIFVYDTELLKREEDDPNSAILYFYPTWVSEHQKTALCGQLLGTVMCLKSILSMPKTVSLQTGKFFLVENGRYILVVGTDRNIPDWVLEHRATLIYSLVNFFHKDFISLAQLYENENLNAKLYHIFDTYLKLMFLGGGFFSQIPLLDLSKTGTDVLATTRIFLNDCKTIPNNLGGMLLYHNKVIHTQLSATTTKKIVFSDPFRIKNPAELSELTFEVPQGVKLLQVYIPGQEFEDLHKNSVQVSSCSGEQVFGDKNIEAVSNNNCEETVPTSASLLKRDTSLLFTSVPEDATFSPHKEVVTRSQDGNKKKSRPNSLNLKSCSLDSVDGGSSNLGKKRTPATPYWSRQSSAVCTPMSENKSFVDQPVGGINNKDPVWKVSMDFHKMNIGHDSNCTNLPEDAFQTICFSCPLEVYTRRLEKAERLSSFVQAALEKTSIYRTSSLVSVFQTNNSISNSMNQYFNFRINESRTRRSITTLRRCKSIHDPLFPWFKKDELAASQYYVEDVLDEDFFVGKNEREESCFRDIITERKRSLTLPIKPHNASEAQKRDMRSPGGFRTPLMNKLSMSDLFKKQPSLKDIPVAPVATMDETQKTDKEKCELRKCILFMYGERDLVLASLLTEECLKNEKSIEKLQQLCVDHLPTLEKQMNASIELPASDASSGSVTDPYSILSVDKDWDTVKRSGPWVGADLNALTRLHGDFMEYSDVSEIYLRKPESVLYGQQDGSTEVFYKEGASSSTGLLGPNDVLGTVHHTAKKRLEKKHDVVIK